MDIQARAGMVRLSKVHVDAPRRPLGRLVQVGIGKDNVLPS